MEATRGDKSARQGARGVGGGKITCKFHLRSRLGDSTSKDTAEVATLYSMIKFIHIDFFVLIDWRKVVENEHDKYSLFFI